MKTIPLCFAILLSQALCLAQGALNFSAYLAKRPSAPFEMRGSETTVVFTLSGNTLSGSGTFQTDRAAADPIVRSSDGAVLSTARFVPWDQGDVGSPFVMIDTIWDPFPIDPPQLDELMRGELTVSIWARIDDGADGYIEGPLLLVPEPRVAALSALGLLCILFGAKRPQNAPGFGTIAVPQWTESAP